MSDTVISIKYNPYTIKTEVKINGQTPKPNSKLNYGNHRLQEWIEELPATLEAEYNGKEFDIYFCGTEEDYEDLLDVVEHANKDSFKIRCEHTTKPKMAISERIATLNDTFAKIQQGPVEKLKTKEIKDAFSQASNDMLSIYVVATMSAGKTTLINALLGNKLIPSQQQACTSGVTEITNHDGLESFEGTALNKENEEIKVEKDLDLKTLESCDNDLDIHAIEIHGEIPLVTSKNIALRLISLPSPSSSKNKDAQVRILKEALNSHKHIILYVLDTFQLGPEDDENLLGSIAKLIKNGGREANERFLFVVNKLDEFKPEEDIQSELQNLKENLRAIGFLDPKIFPVSTQTALSLCTTFKDKTLDDKNCHTDIIDFPSVRTMIDNEQLHLEQYAPLSEKLKKEIETKATQIFQSDHKMQNLLIAFMHTGIPSLETAIMTYVTKYAYPMKIKNISDSFLPFLNHELSTRSIKQSVIGSEAEKIHLLSKTIDTIENTLSHAKANDEFKATLDAKINDVQKKATEEIESFKKNIHNLKTILINKHSDSFSKKEIQKTQAEDIVNEFKEMVERVEADTAPHLRESLKKYYQDTFKNIPDEFARWTDTLMPDYHKREDQFLAHFKNEADSKGKTIYFSGVMLSTHYVGSGSTQNARKDNLSKALMSGAILGTALGLGAPVAVAATVSLMRLIAPEASTVKTSDLYKYLTQTTESLESKLCNALSENIRCATEGIQNYVAEYFDNIHTYLDEQRKRLPEAQLEKSKLEEDLKPAKWLMEIKEQVESTIAI
ncbi:dynamin family protein [Synergistaceae bacterium OttesenSCG-928-D05]|nr:dynamin family protein [Synergistaceae bacterium OttesenSCG-928-D05]